MAKKTTQKSPPDAETPREQADVESMEVEILPERSSDVEGAGELLKNMDGIMPKHFNAVTEPSDSGIASDALSSSTIPDWILGDNG